MVGELLAHSNDGLVAVTVEATCWYPQGGAVAEGAESDAVLSEVTRVGEQLRDVLYDTAADAARQLAAMTRMSISIPYWTPDAKYSIWDISEPEPDEEGNPEPGARAALEGAREHIHSGEADPSAAL